MVHTFILVLLVIKLAAGNSCDSGWLQASKFCYRVMPRKNYFYRAARMCSNEGARLPEFATLEDSEAFAKEIWTAERHFPDSFWLGMYGFDGLKYTERKGVLWLQSGSLGLGYFSPFKPQPSKSGQSVLTLNKAHPWVRYKGYKEKDFVVCQYEIGKGRCRLCDKDWIPTGKLCIYLHHRSKNFRSAEKYCSKRGATLPIVHSADDNDHLRFWHWVLPSAKRSGKGRKFLYVPVWLGLKPKNITNLILSSDAWNWIDNTALKTNAAFFTNHKVPRRYQFECVFLLVRNGEWLNFVRCSLRAWASCQKPIYPSCAA